LKPWDNAAVVRLVRDEIERSRVERRATMRAEREWRDAQAVQRALLPSVLPDVPGFSVASRWEPALGFGGDYYDVVPMADGRVALCVADVCGKGLPAALLVASLQATVRASLDGHAPHEVVTTVNRALCQQAAHGRFVTLCLVVVDPSSGILTFCNAGHHASMLMRRDGSVVRLDRGGMLAGVFADAGYESGRTTLAAGDRLLLFTDGLVEAMDATGAEFGDGALVDRLRREADSNAARLIASIFDDVRRWSGGPLSDDATALALVAERTWTASSHNRTSVADPRVQRGAIRAKTSPTAGADVA
jgi:sigma-B regulation protein RsbU (phosphoserine phosphatase)